MEEQGATARQLSAAASGIVDDENSQAEGTVEGAIGFARNESTNNNNNGAQQQQQNHPHYENIYESIEQYNAAIGGAVAGAAAAIAVAPADDLPQHLHQQPQSQQQQQTLNEVIANPTANTTTPNHNNNNNNTSNVNNNNALQQRLLSSIHYRNDLYDRTNTNSPAYDVPRSVRSGLGFRRNFQLDLHGANRFNGARYTTGSSAYTCPRQRSFDDTESHNYYNLNYQPSLRYENIYEQIRDEPIYRNTGSGARVYGRLNVIGHGIGRIERHLSSSCGNIDHFNLGGHYAVLGHSHFGTVGHIRLNAGSNNSSSSSTTSSVLSSNSVSNGAANVVMSTNQKDANNVKNSASSFFSCLHGENSQSMSNIYRATTGATNSNVLQQASVINGTPNMSKERETRSASAGPLTAVASTVVHDAIQTLTTNRQTGAIPKIKNANVSANKSNSQTSTAEKSITVKNAVNKKTSSTVAQPSSVKSSAEHNNGTLNRISKSSLQWLLVNKWLPLWIGQGPDCKVIDFNFMFSRDCVGCDGTTSISQLTNPYGTPRLGRMPQDIVRFNARAEMHAPCAAAAAAAALRRESTLQQRPLHSTLNRLREAEIPSNNTNRREFYRYEDPSYENVHVQWQNGFEFGRSRDYEHSYQQQQQQSRPQLQRARSESPNFNNQQQRRLRGNNSTSSQVKYGDPFKSYKLNTENNTFKPKNTKVQNLENVEVTKCDGTTTTTTITMNTSDAIVVTNSSAGSPPVNTNTATLTMPTLIQQQAIDCDELEGAVGENLSPISIVLVDSNDVATTISGEEMVVEIATTVSTASSSNTPSGTNATDIETDTANTKTTNNTEQQNDD